ncbi:MAG: hypothetical protein ACR2NN_10770 [Bryobacteraceae bacterium]
MKKIMSLMLGMTLVLGAASMFAQDTTKPATDTTKTKKHKKMKKDKMKKGDTTTTTTPPPGK